MLGVFLRLADFVFGKAPHDMRRSAHDKRTFWEFLILRNERPCPDNAVGLDVRPVHHYGSHADKHAVVDGTGMQYGVVPDNHIVADMDSDPRGEMDSHIVLNVGPLPDADFGKVGPEDRIIEHGRIVADFHITDKACTLGNKNALANLGSLSLVFD